MLSKKSKYALKAALYLTGRYGGGPCPVAEIARIEHIPRKFLEAILLELRNRGVLHSVKGKAGGFMLARSPAEITVGEIIRVLDGPLALVPCVSVTAYRRCVECEDENSCGIRMLFKEVRDETARLLDGTTLSTMWRRAQESRAAGGEGTMYHI